MKSLDLGLSKVDISLDRDNTILSDGSVINFRNLERLAERSNAIYFPEEGNLYQVGIMDGHFYKLVPARAKFPKTERVKY